MKGIAIAKTSFDYINENGFIFHVNQGDAYLGIITPEGDLHFVQYVLENGINHRFEVHVPANSGRMSIHRIVNNFDV